MTTPQVEPDRPADTLDEDGIATLELPLIPLRDTVIFPRMVSSLLVGRDRSLKAVEAAMAQDRTIVVAAQRNPSQQDVSLEDIYEIGTEAVIGRLLKMPDGSTNLLVQGQRRVRILAFSQIDPWTRATVVPIEETEPPSEAGQSLMRSVQVAFEKCAKLSGNIAEEAQVAAVNADTPGWLADLVASTIELSVPQRQELLETLDSLERLEKVRLLLAKELDVLELQNQIHGRARQKVDDAQREFILREQLKEIQRELGDAETHATEISEYREKIAELGMPQEVMQKAEEELGRLASLPSSSPEVSVIRNYLDWLVSLPWSKESVDNLDIELAARVLDAHHYGLPKVKERILEHIAVRKLAGSTAGATILCFVGPPGVGKTSLGRSIATALGRTFVRVSLGGIRDEAEIRGHRRTYIGALPGRIIQALRNAGTINPVYMMDEIDKVGMDFRGDPSAALLEVLDPEQNFAFVDHYLDVPYNLSKVMFITTANILEPIPPPLRDRMEVIELPGYVEEEKLHIARQFLVSKQLSQHGLGPDRVRFSEGALKRIISVYTREAGVRNLEREIGTICRKIARAVAEGEHAPSLVGASSLGKYLGPPRFLVGEQEEADAVGVAMGVHWTEAGGDLTTVEATVMAGQGELVLTGQLGDVMKESAMAALSYTRARANDLGLASDFYEKSDIHIHLPAGAVPKDGPSAGITMATALISALTKRPVRRDVVMTGEITIRGRVLAVGGLKEKALAAHRAGMRTLVLPRKNSKDLTDIPEDIRKRIQFVCVERMDEVLEVALSVSLPLAKPVPERVAEEAQETAAVEGD